MKNEIERAMKEVLEAWERPDNQEDLVCAIYQMKRIYMAEVIRKSKQQRYRYYRKKSQHTEK